MGRLPGPATQVTRLQYPAENIPTYKRALGAGLHQDHWLGTETETANHEQSSHYGAATHRMSFCLPGEGNWISGVQTRRPRLYGAGRFCTRTGSSEDPGGSVIRRSAGLGEIVTKGPLQLYIHTATYDLPHTITNGRRG